VSTAHRHTCQGCLRLAHVQSPYVREGHSGGALIDDQKCVVGMVLQTDSLSAGAIRSDRLGEILLTEIKVPAVHLAESVGACTASLLDVKPSAGSVKEFHGLKYVWLPKGFWMGVTEVTQEAFEQMMGTNPSHYKGADLPVENVSWGDAAAYCQAAGGRLPTDAEWEYAARGGERSDPYGILEKIAWYKDNSESKPHPAGGLVPNKFGLFDMLGNVWEWTADLYSASTPVSRDSQGSSSSPQRVLRGGSWEDGARYARASVRLGDGPGVRSSNAGFRCARD